MTITKRRMLVFFIVNGVFLLLVLSGIAYFFVSNKAPILQGKVHYRIPYKANQTLDIYRPINSLYEKAPVLIYFHGGAWVVGRKEAINMNRFNGAINTLREAGYCVISPSYTLAKDGKSPFPECIKDAYDAISWLEKHGEEFQLDLRNVGIFGESAGAHIAMMVAFAQPESFEASPHSIKFNYLIDVYGPADMDMLYHGPTLDTIGAYLNKLPASVKQRLDLSRKLFGFDPAADSIRANDFMKRYSPSNYLTEKAPPTLIIHGNSDRVVPVEQSLQLRKKLDILGIPNEYHELDKVDHGFIKAKKDQRRQVQTWLSNFVQEHYAN